MDVNSSTLKIVGYQVSTGSVGNVNPSNNKVELIIDNVQEQGFNIKRVITENPTTRGTPNADHTFRMPTTYSIKGLLSSSTLSSSLDFNVNSLFGSSNYLSTKMSNILKISLGQYVFEVYTGLNIFPGMGIQEIFIGRERSTFNALSISITFKELIMASDDNQSKTKSNSDRPAANQGVKHG